MSNSAIQSDQPSGDTAVNRSLPVEESKHPGIAFIDGLVVRLLFLGLVVLLGVFVWQAMNNDTTPFWALSRSTDAALIEANDRIVQLAQWVISTVLLVGTALIGLNWYQGEKRYQADRERDERRLAQFSSQMEDLSKQVRELLENKDRVAETLSRAQTLLDFLDQAHQINSSDRFFIVDDRLERLVTDYGTTDADSRRKIVVYVIETLKRERNWVLEQMKRQHGKDEVLRRALDRCVTVFRPDYPEAAIEIENVIAQMDTIVRLSAIGPGEPPIDFRG